MSSCTEIWNRWQRLGDTVHFLTKRAIMKCLTLSLILIPWLTLYPVWKTDNLMVLTQNTNVIFNHSDKSKTQMLLLSQSFFQFWWLPQCHTPNKTVMACNFLSWWVRKISVSFSATLSSATLFQDTVTLWTHIFTGTIPHASQGSDGPYTDDGVHDTFTGLLCSCWCWFLIC